MGPTVATLALGDTTFSLHDEGGGCLALEMDHPGLQSTVERACFEGEHVVDVSDACGWLATEEPPSGCGVTLPVVFYGRVREPDIGYLCVGTIRSSEGTEEVTSARFLPLDGDGFLLAEAHPNEARAAHLFTHGGLRYGQPPLDAPSDTVYRLCEEQAPWGSTEASP